jgi:medium-chain acyl-[acyl-carrier-protein] hydrolase
MGPEIEICAVQLPGREGRFREPRYTDLAAFLEGTLEAITPLLDRPFALLGYSVGAIFAYALALRLEARGTPPSSLVVIACPPPGQLEARALKSTMPDSQFEARMFELSENPGPLKESLELVRLMATIMRADLRIAESLKPGEIGKLCCPVIAVGGQSDPVVELQHIENWRLVSNNSFEYQTFPGGHFFARERPSEVISWIATRIFSR